MTNLEKLTILAEALHGPRWQHATARDLNMSSRQVHRWASGDGYPHEGHIADLIKAAEIRRYEIEQAIDQISNL